MYMGFMMSGRWIYIYIYIYTAEPLVPESSLVEVEIVIGKLKSYKSPGSGQILAELVKAGVGTLYS
jgi:hypothetical protein